MDRNCDIAYDIALLPFTKEEYHDFFRRYEPDPVMDPEPFRYNAEQIDRSYRYNYGGFRENYAHYGIFLGHEPVGSLQLKRMNPETGVCEIGIILRDDSVKNRGIGTSAIRLAMKAARQEYGMSTMIGDTMVRNRRMIRVFEKLGFILAERIEGGFELSDGSRQDRLVFRKDLLDEESGKQRKETI